MQVVRLSALPMLYMCMYVYVCVCKARRPHSCTLNNLDMISGGNYYMIPSVIEKSSYLPSRDVIGKEACDYRGWRKWGPPGSPADGPEPLHPTIPAAGNPSLIFFLCFLVEMIVTMQAVRVGKVLWDVSSALKRNDGVLLHGVLELRLLEPITPLHHRLQNAASGMLRHPLHIDIHTL